MTAEEFLEGPRCLDCQTHLRLLDDREWPDDPRLWLCSGCMTRLAEQNLKDIAELNQRLHDRTQGFLASERRLRDEMNGQSEKLREIKTAVRDYYFALDSREHGGVACGHLRDRIEAVLGMNWVQMAETKRRKKLKSPNP